jgi:hypothetical protein
MNGTSDGSSGGEAGGDGNDGWLLSSPSGLYNGMISPLLGFPIKGVVWYQGEANANRADPYACQMRAMIEGWRNLWNNPPALKNFAFVLHQLSACTSVSIIWFKHGALMLLCTNTLIARDQHTIYCVR